MMVDGDSRFQQEINNEQENEDTNIATSALRENIRLKGKNAYYFAHENTPKGPAWDGKPEPQRLLEKHHHVSLERKYSSFDIHKSNITKYSFCDGSKSVKLYIDIEDTVKPEHVSLDFTDESLSLVVDQQAASRENEETDQPESQPHDQQQSSPRTLYFTKLAGKITNASFKVKSEDKLLVVILKKQIPGETWHTINARGAPDHEVV